MLDSNKILNKQIKSQCKKNLNVQILLSWNLFLFKTDIVK